MAVTLESNSETTQLGQDVLQRIEIGTVLQAESGIPTSKFQMPSLTWTMGIVISSRGYSITLLHITSTLGALFALPHDLGRLSHIL